jgi:hypothetical protein
MTTSEHQIRELEKETAELRTRPGRNLLVALKIIGKDPADFAVEAKMSTGSKAANDIALRKYTRPAPGGSLSGRPSPKWPSPEMVARWATLLGVESEFFYLKNPRRSAAARALRRAKD